jgi:hypothetical protein
MINVQRLRLPIVALLEWGTGQRKVLALALSPSTGRRDKARLLVEPALALLIVVMAIVVIVKLAHAGQEWLAARRLSQTYTELTGVKPEILAAQLAQRDEMVKRISKHPLIAPPPQFQLTGVLGDAAIFNGGMLLKAGQSAGEMKILSIGPNWIEVETNGQKQKMYVFQPSPEAGSSAGGPPPPGMSGRRSGRSRPPPPGD